MFSDTVNMAQTTTLLRDVCHGRNNSTRKRKTLQYTHLICIEQLTVQNASIHAYIYRIKYQCMGSGRLFFHMKAPKAPIK